MKRKGITLIIAMAMGSFFMAGLVLAQDQPKSDPKMDEMMKKWQEMAAPGEHHKLLDQFVGSWEAASKMWMDGPDKPALESKGMTVVSWVLGNRFLEEKYTGEMMGQPYQGIGHYGYDNFRQEYQFFWMDNSSTAMYVGSGSYNADQKILSFPIKMDDFMTGEKGKPALYRYLLVSPDKRIFEMYDGPAANPQKKVGEIVYTRK